MPVVRNANHSSAQAVDSVLLRYSVAVCGAWAAEIVTFPLDLVKTRLQIQSEMATSKHGYKLENLGLVQTAVGIAKKEGIPKLWSGLMPMFQRHAIYSGCRLIFYEQFRNRFRDENGQVSIGVASFGGVAAGSLAQFIASPADLVKVQMQAEGRRVLQGKKSRFTTSRQVYLMLYRESGILGFWRGAIPNMQRAALVNIGDLAAYDYAKQYLIREFGFSDTLGAHTLAALAAGLVAAVLGTPADMLKTRLMNQPVGPDGRGILYRGMIDCLQQSVRNEGPLVLYKGFLPLWIRLGPWTLINWVVFEKTMLLVGGRTF